MVNKKQHKLVKISIIIILLVGFLYYQNNNIGITRLEVQSYEIPKAFHGYRILQISDLHNKTFGKNQEKLIKKIIHEAPDLIVITGDLVDSRHYNEEACLELLSGIKDVAPIYYVTGNHESRVSAFTILETKLEDIGVNILRNEGLIVNKGNSSIRLLGVDDPKMLTYNNVQVQINMLTEALSDKYTILLSHRPELLNIYVDCSIDLVFSGHAHGGQFRFPIIGGLLAPNQGWLPKYTEGIYQQGAKRMIVSRGLGNSLFPQRLFNKPELVVVTLKN